MGPGSNNFGGGYTLSSPTLESPFSNANFSFDTSGIASAFSGFVSGLEVFLSFLSIFFMLAIIYIVIQRNVSLASATLHAKKVRDEKKAASSDDSIDEDGEMPETAIHEPKALPENPPMEGESDHPRFDHVLEHVETDNQSDWRFAVIEADNILYEVLSRGGFRGETLGEMLSNANPAGFTTLEHAWEAHKTRNMIAHERDFVLTKREAKRIVSLYESVLREFRYL